MRFGHWLAAIAALGIALRIVNTLLVAPWPPPAFGDELYYSLLANLISQGEGFVRPGELLSEGLSVPTAERPPLYPLVLAGLAELGATGADAQRLLGAATGGGTIIALGILVRRLAGPRAGLLAAGLAALYPTLIAADGALMTESLYGLLTVLALIAAYRVVDDPGVGRAVVLGAVLGLAALTRGETLFLLPLLLVPLLRRPRGPLAAAVVCLAFVLVLAPWAVRNWSVFDRPVLVATTAGETFGGANCESTYYGGKIGGWDVACVEQSGRGNEAAELNEEGREGISYAFDHVGRVPLVLAARLGRTWGFETSDVPEGRARGLHVLGVVMYFALVPLAVYGFLLLRRRKVAVWILVTPFITVTLTALLAYGSVRFRHSAELSLVALAAVALDRLSRRPARRSPPSRATTASG